MWLSLAGSARWRRREMRIGTRGKAVVQPVSLPSSRTRNVGKATWFSGLSPGVLGVWALLASGLLFRFCFWVSSCRVVLALFGRLSSSPGCVSKKRQRPRAPTQRPGFPTDRPRAERALGGGRERGATTRGPIFWQVPPMIYLAVGLAVGYLFWSLSCPLLSSSPLLSHVCSNPPAGAGGRTSTSRAGSLRGSCLSFSRGAHAHRHRLSYGTTPIPKVTHERRWFP